jgi:hypothetical protein
MLMCCVCVFWLRQESPDMILEDEPLILEEVMSQGRQHCARYRPPKEEEEDRWPALVKNVFLKYCS